MSLTEPAFEDPTLVPDVESGQPDAFVARQRRTPQQLPESVPSLERLLSEAVVDILALHAAS